MNTYYELIDHTADIGIRLSAESLTALFVKSAAAMFDVIAQKSQDLAGARCYTKHIQLSAKNREELLLAWMGELLSLGDCDNVIFTEFEINHLSDGEIEAQASGFDRKYFDVIREVKAVTYHGLRIRPTDNGFEAEIIFDV